MKINHAYRSNTGRRANVNVKRCPRNDWDANDTIIETILEPLYESHETLRDIKGALCSTYASNRAAYRIVGYTSAFASNLNTQLCCSSDKPHNHQALFCASYVQKISVSRWKGAKFGLLKLDATQNVSAKMLAAEHI